MIVIDVNVLVAAFLRDHPHHDRALPYLTGVLTDDEVVVPDAVWSGFLRIVTNPRIFDRPATATAATDFVRSVCGSARYRNAPGLTDGIEPFLRLLVDADAAADLVPDAYIASVAFAHGCAVASFDRDFRRFDGLRLVSPR